MINHRGTETQRLHREEFRLKTELFAFSKVVATGDFEGCGLDPRAMTQNFSQRFYDYASRYR
jgi:hypothetical protein